MTKSRRLLLLGGTTESLSLGVRLAALGAEDVITSLAGRTPQHQRPAGTVRIGGFGGVSGLETFLRSNEIDVVIDATHPFARTISSHARIACAEVGVPRLQVMRWGWQADVGDCWYDVPDMAFAASTLIGLAKRVFLAVGRQELAAFSHLSEIELIIRTIVPPAQPLPLTNHHLILAQGPFSQAEEETLFRQYGIQAVVSKNSGGDATYGKIAAARALGLPVIMVRRPLPEPGAVVHTVDEALIWLQSLNAPTLESPG